MTGPLQVAIIGSGPSGAFAAQALTGADAVVDVLDRLPVPYGLVRYGVAPDHQKIKSIIDSLRPIFERPEVRFLGNVEFGRDLGLADLQQHYDAVIVASGASVDRRLQIPGEELAGVFPATEFVSWYSGHPDALVDRFTLDAESVAVVGVGNVALDVARMLARTSAELRATDVPEHVLDVLHRSRVRDIHLIGRRGPAQARFSSKELLELGHLDNADVLIDPQAVKVPDEVLAGLDSGTRRMVAALQTLAGVAPAGRARRIHLHFNARPAEVLGEDRIRALRIERTSTGADGIGLGSGQTQDIQTQMLLRAVGYLGVRLDGIPFDPASGTIPQEDGRVLRDGVRVPGLYAAGWIKRGPTGVIGTNKRDAAQTVAALLADAPTLPRAPERDRAALLRLLAGRGVDVVQWPGWQAIDAEELARGLPTGRGRVKVHDRADLLQVARGSTAAPAPPH